MGEAEWVDLRERLREILREKSLRLAPPGKPFVLTSGLTSNHYIDGKKTTSDPEGLHCLARLLLENCRREQVESIGGPTIGADPIVGAVASLSFTEGRPLPLFLVRKEAKKHGTQSQVEGTDIRGKRVIIVEDVITTGGSVLSAIEAVRSAGAEVVKVVAIVDREQGGREAFKQAGIRYEPIFSIRDILPEGYLLSEST